MSSGRHHILDSLISLLFRKMETFHLLHLASSWRPQSTNSAPGDNAQPSSTIPPSHLPATPAIETSPSTQPPPTLNVSVTPRIRAAAVQMIFANRVTQDFITPEAVKATEAWSGRAVLEALAAFSIPNEVSGPCYCVWFLDLLTVTRRICTRKVEVYGRKNRWNPGRICDLAYPYLLKARWVLKLNKMPGTLFAIEGVYKNYTKTILRASRIHSPNSQFQLYRMYPIT